MPYNFIDNSEKVAIIEAQARTLEYSKFTLEVSLMAENAKSSPDNDVLLSLNRQIAEKDRQITSLVVTAAELREGQEPL